MSARKIAQIGINAQLLSGRAGYRQAGIHDYISGLLRHLPARPDYAYTVFTGADTAALLDNPALTPSTTRWPTERRLARIAWEQLVWPLAARRQRLALLHSLAFVTPVLAPCPTLVTVYDLSFLHFPDRFPGLQRLYLTTQTRRSCRAAQRVIAISAAGAADIEQRLGVPRAQIDIVYPGVDPAFQPLPAATTAAFRRQKGLPEQFILHVGTLQPRKNIPVLLDALARLRRPDIALVLVGGKGWLYDEIFARVEQHGLQGQVHFAGFVPDAELPLWYNAAALFAFPSVYEGFGMPVIQAMACGTPVIASNASAIPEAAGTAALTFAPADVDTLINHIATVLDRPEQRAMMRDQGLIQAKQFQWTRSGQALAAVYEKVLNQI